jgi:hypothetical protein
LYVNNNYLFIIEILKFNNDGTDYDEDEENERVLKFDDEFEETKDLSTVGYTFYKIKNFYRSLKENLFCC